VERGADHVHACFTARGIVEHLVAALLACTDGFDQGGLMTSLRYDDAHGCDIVAGGLRGSVVVVVLDGGVCSGNGREDPGCVVSLGVALRGGWAGRAGVVVN
jgi:hypothetical protein